ncbi:NAD kinase 2, chloroplastic-like isoform X2 [Macadamia integrifolia]|uniref:NAD kinase 2, chloroplastic-like isoform X2 n=1 Tax=Macadamia integrifolia TaxID=60698 RepID=UPI001C4FBACE|nr:NAD kinase 2, chloroplastic-like isoform X2 [Macadamia integrifolia]
MNRTVVTARSQAYPVKKLSLLPSCKRKSSFFGFGYLPLRKERLGLKFVVGARLSNFSYSRIGLDTQTFQSQDLSQFSRIGPVPGDIAEFEAYCRIFRAAEQIYTAIVDTLCNPLTGECAFSYEQSGDQASLEDKLVAVLGCVVALLNKSREDVLSRRSSFMNSFRGSDVNLLEDKLPPLAIFRNEMKRCCQSLHVALENYLVPSSDQSIIIWRKLQRLKNVCYDAGFPCRDGYPFQALLANWTPIYLSPQKEPASKDSEVAFWTGGQVTDEGLDWLLEKGYKTIVDLRAEVVNDYLYQASIDDAVLNGKLEMVKLPVKVGTGPSMEQVKKFEFLVADSNKNPIYLHSQEGVQRTSAMVSRWRQYATRSGSQLVPSYPVIMNGMQTEDSRTEGGMQIFLNSEGVTCLEDDNKLLPQMLVTSDSPQEISCGHVSPTLENHNSTGNGSYRGLVSSRDTISTKGADGNGFGSFAPFSRETEPLKSQIPNGNVFSRKEMSRFFRSRKISPPPYFYYERKRLGVMLVSRETSTKTSQNGEILEAASISGLMESGSSNRRFSDKKYMMGTEKYMVGDTFGSLGSILNSFGREEEKYVDTENNVSTSLSVDLERKVTSRALKEEHESNAQPSIASDNDDLELVEGNMCSSNTGVVRVQSRKKAEMFLVRTDGFSCTREKVTESFLAFTHPSAQQQMLMWKSTPKTVLLLKKLEQELMEEAKEEKINVLVEPDVHDIFSRIPGFGFVQTFNSQDTSDLHERVDFVACLGGDGVILHASNLFRGAVPPVVSFNLGSLGFLTSHNFADYRQVLRQVIHGNDTLDGVYITLRMRLRCEIFRNGKTVPGKVFDVLNEVVVDRGSNPYLSKIECYEHDHLITKVQGDGVIVATPTGSTAYSTSAGGSMVHPNVPCMLFTPICPHSLSFRPVILPDSARLELKIPEDARSNAWVSFDGKRRQQLSRGDSVRISMSKHPLPTVNKFDQTGEWFLSLIRCLNWNERLEQKAL